MVQLPDLLLDVLLFRACLSVLCDFLEEGGACLSYIGLGGIPSLDEADSRRGLREKLCWVVFHSDGTLVVGTCADKAEGD